MQELNIIYQGNHDYLKLGTLAYDDQTLIFQYSQTAVQRGLELSPIHLPLRYQAYPNWQGEYRELLGLPGLLHDTLPDGWGLRLMDRKLKQKNIRLDTITVMDRLAYLGHNTMGALTFEPALNEKFTLQDLSLLQLAQEIQHIIIDDSAEVLDELAKVGGSPGGARPKAAVFYNPKTGEMSTETGHIENEEAWLVKFPADQDEPDSCALEELYARLARSSGIQMENTQFFALQDGLSAFGTRRFDRKPQHRVHMHSLAGLLHIHFQIPSIGYAELLRLTRRLTRDIREVKKALQRCIFNVLMHNRDDHAKNIAFLLNPRNEWELAPAYDLTYCPGYRGEHFMDIAGEGKYPARSHILQVAKEGGLSDKIAQENIDSMLNSLSDSHIKQTAEALPIRKKVLKTILEDIQANRQRLTKN
jgi:serine/threonine-protein kinase HipA